MPIFDSWIFFLDLVYFGNVIPNAKRSLHCIVIGQRHLRDWQLSRLVRCWKDFHLRWDSSVCCHVVNEQATVRRGADLIKPIRKLPTTSFHKSEMRILVTFVGHCTQLANQQDKVRLIDPSGEA
jgi:hypothetical protein